MEAISSPKYVLTSKLHVVTAHEIILLVSPPPKLFFTQALLLSNVMKSEFGRDEN
jgi:hypothetical protein